MQPSREAPTAWPLRHIPIPQRASLTGVTVVLAVYVGITCYVQLLAQPEPAKWFPPAWWLPNATAGLVNVTLAFTVPIQLIVIGGLLLGIFRFRPREIGLVLAKLPAGVLLTAVAWAAAQVVFVIVCVLAGQEIAVNPRWQGADWTQEAGAWLGQLFGNTPLEEVVFRGFLLPQCVLLVLSSMPKARPAIAIVAAVVVSQALFAVTHVFFNARQPEGQWLLLAQFTMGLAFAGVYLRTGNLFLAMGLHALVNNPSPLLTDPFPGPGVQGAIIFLGILIAVIFGPWFVGWLRRYVKRADTTP